MPAVRGQRTAVRVQAARVQSARRLAARIRRARAAAARAQVATRLAERARVAQARAVQGPAARVQAAVPRRPAAGDRARGSDRRLEQPAETACNLAAQRALA